MKTVIYYQNDRGIEPFADWLFGLKDVVARVRIIDRLARIETGNLGDHRSVGDGVQELRMTFGPGYRVYFGQDGDRIVVLLTGGDKGSQAKDITKAKKFWKDYLVQKNG